MIEFQVENMNCKRCAAAPTNAVQAVDAGVRVQVEVQSGRVQVESNYKAEHLGAAITEAGYTVKGVTPSAAKGT
jgi:copper chaperone